MQNPDENLQLLIPIIAGTILITGLSVFTIYFIFQYKKVQIKYSLEKQQFKQTLLEAEIEIREQTLKHVSRELHDNIGQIASLLKINLNLILKNEEYNSKNKEGLQSSLDLIKQLISDIRSLSSDLNCDMIRNVGLVEAIKTNCNRINKAGVETKLDANDLKQELKPETEIILYRMSQEILNNVLKHSEAKSVQVQIFEKDGALNLQFIDDGKGFKVENLPKAKGQGIQNLYDRCGLLGASFYIKSTPEKGTKIIIRLPLTRNPNEKSNFEVSRS